MGILTDDMKRVVRQQRMGFMATVSADGTPNLSPKGTSTVWDDDHLVFANLGSPVTIENLMDERKLLQKRFKSQILNIFKFKVANLIIFDLFSVLDSEENTSKLIEQNANLTAKYERTQTTLNEIAQEHSHLLYLQEKKNNRK